MSELGKAMAEPFLVLGAMKAGTTTLDALLRAHPDVEVVAEKETSQLADPSSAAQLALRISSSRARRAGEVTAGYLQSPVLPQPVSTAEQLLGSELALIAIVRDPVERAVSHWRHARQLGRETREIDEALLDPSATYLAFSSYHEQLAPWVSRFGLSRIHLIRLEDYRDDPAPTVGALWDFLGVDRRSSDREVVRENTAETRVVATGWRRSLRDSSLYRRRLRPILGARARRGLAAGLGGGRHREGASPTDETVARFRAAVADDVGRLASVWPHAAWASP